MRVSSGWTRFQKTKKQEETIISSCFSRSRLIHSSAYLGWQKSKTCPPAPATAEGDELGSLRLHPHEQLAGRERGTGEGDLHGVVRIARGDVLNGAGVLSPCH